MHRTFVAIPVPSGVRPTVAALVKKLKEEVPTGAFHFVDPENWHITLSFLGDQDDQAIGRVAVALPAIVPVLDMPLEVRFDHVRYWQNPSDPSAIVLVGDQQTTKALGGVRDALEEGLIRNEVQFRPDNRRFTAHITLARRTKESVLLPDIDGAVDISFAPTSVDFLESLLGRGGSRYEVLLSEPVEDEL